MKRNFRQIVVDRVGVLPLVALITFLVDQVSKVVVVFWLDLITRIEMDVLPPFLVFRMAWNDGMNFGLFGDDSAVGAVGVGGGGAGHFGLGVGLGAARGGGRLGAGVGGVADWRGAWAMWWTGSSMARWRIF